MRIIDSQVHVWPADRPDRPLLRDGQGRENSPYRYEQLLADMDRAGVDCAILVPPSIEGDRNDYALEAAQKHPGRFAVMGRFPVKTGKGRNLLDGWREQPGMLGVRFTFHRDADRPHRELALGEGRGGLECEQRQRRQAGPGVQAAGSDHRRHLHAAARGCAAGQRRHSAKPRPMIHSRSSCERKSSSSVKWVTVCR